MALNRRAPDAPPDFFPGYADVVEIGSGSLSTVYRAREIATGRWLALKLFNVRDTPSGALTAYERDSRAITALAEHPNIVSLHGSFRVGEDERPVQVLELCPTSVAALLRQNGAVPVRDVVSLGVKIAGALESAHRADVLHRDVKPPNILVTRSGQPALADFGVAALQPTAAVTATRAGMTVLHMAPELLERGEPTAATDVYELAATLYHLITGRGAFRAEPGEQPAVVIGRIVRDAVPPLSVQQAPPRLSALLLAAMSKDPADRPATAAGFAAELGAIEVAHRWPRTEFVVRDVVPAPSGAATGWTPPPAQEWFPADAGAPATTPAATTPPAVTPASTEWSEPTRSAPRHARPDDDDVEDGGNEGDGTEVDTADADDVEPEPAADQYAAFEAAAVHAPPTTVNPIMPAKQGRPGASSGDAWSDVSLSVPARPRPSPTPNPVPPVEQPSATVDPVGAADDLVDPGVTTAHPLWRQERAAAAAEAAAAEVAPPTPTEPPSADATVQHVVPPEPDVNDTVARYPIRPPGPSAGEQTSADVPAWVFREPEQPEAAGAPYGDDLTIDPMSLRRRVTLRAGGHALVVDDTKLIVRAWLHRSEIAWPDVLGFEPRFAGVGASGSGGQLVALTRSGPVELPATKRSMADLLYVQALLDAYRHRAQM